LSTRRGKIEITWQVTDVIEKSVELVWLSVADQRSGREHRRASAQNWSRVISHDLDGKIKIDFDPAGVRWTIAFPVGRLVGGAAASGAAGA
jgi:two-component sensor histidine kinase